MLVDINLGGRAKQRKPARRRPAAMRKCGRVVLDPDQVAGRAPGLGFSLIRSFSGAYLIEQFERRRLRLPITKPPCLLPSDQDDEVAGRFDIAPFVRLVE